VSKQSPKPANAKKTDKRKQGDFLVLYNIKIPKNQTQINCAANSHKAAKSLCPKSKMWARPLKKATPKNKMPKTASPA
jgi:hypothetical protein